MSKIALSPDPNGAGIFTIASPNSGTNRTLTLPDNTGTVVSTASTPTFTGAVTAPAFTPNSSTVPTDGMYLPTTSTVAFATGTTERMRIDSSGNLLVGATSAVLSGKITSSFAGNSINGITFNDTTSATGSGFCIFSIGGSLIGTISRNGATSAVQYNTTSDQRLKSNITDSQSVIDKLMTVKVRQFDWTNGDVHQDYGFIAQELEPVLSGIVTKGKTDEDMWQLDYAKLTPHLVKAIQELNAKVEAQAAEIAALKGSK